MPLFKIQTDILRLLAAHRDPESYGAEVLNKAEAFVAVMPTDKLGLLFLKDGQVVQPDPARLEDYQIHAGQRRGQWPSSLDITAAMLERHHKKPNDPA